MIGSYPDWIKKFNVSDDDLNPPLIEKLHQEKQFLLSENLKIRKTVQARVSELTALKLENQKLSLQLNEARARSTLMLILSVLGSVLVGIGVNVATGNPQGWIGWILVGFWGCS